MVNINSLSGYQSQYVSADDLGNSDHCVTIQNVTVETMKDFDGKDQQKAILHFAEPIQTPHGAFNKPLVLNKTGKTVIEDAYGSETNDWLQKPITLFKAFGNNGKPFVQLRPGAPQQNAVQQGIDAQAPLAQQQNSMNGPAPAPAADNFPGDR